MEFQDRSLECVDCHQSFVFTAGEQEFYARKGFREEPKRCKACREMRKAKRDQGGGFDDTGMGGVVDGNRRAGGGNRTREMFDAVCAACGAPTRVPFKPTPGRPVYCKECYANRGAGG